MYLAQQNYALAETAFYGALGVNESSVDALVGLGIVLDERGQHNEATARFREALQQDPDNASVLSNLGYSHYLAGDLAAAEAFLTRAVDIDLDHPQANANLALVRAIVGDDAGALEAFRRVNNPQQALNDIGYLELLQSRPGTARVAFRESLDMSGTPYTPGHSQFARGSRQRRFQ